MPTFDEALDCLDKDKVEKEILAEGYSGDISTINRWIDNAGSTWLRADWEKFKKVELLEHEIAYPKAKGIPALKGVIDLCAILKTKKRHIIDWKTTPGQLTDKWTNKHRKSWQWRLYAYLARADSFEYRGLSSFPPYVKNVVIAVPENNDKVVEEYLKSEYACMEFLRNSDFAPYPKNWSSCNDYSNLCPRYQDCLNSTEPKRVPPQLVVLSYSRLATFGACKERFRRDMLDREAEELGTCGPRESIPMIENGKAFHRGIAEVYRQIFRVQG